MKIAEIEEAFGEQGFTEELFAVFLQALKRVPKDLRSQHCCTAACELDKRDAANAIRMIEYSLEHFENSWQDRMRSYLALGDIYESVGKYPNAKQAYQTALESIPREHQKGYRISLSMRLLRTALHCADFAYTDEIHALYQTVCQATPFEGGSRSFLFYRSIAAMLVAAHENDPTARHDAYRDALKALDGDSPTQLDRIIKKHRYADGANATEEALAFLKQQNIPL